MTDPCDVSSPAGRARALERVKTFVTPASDAKECRAIATAALGALEQPIPMILYCPACGTKHVDAPEPGTDWTNPPHRSHRCHGCEAIWRPADVPTVGVDLIATRGAADTWIDNADGDPAHPALVRRLSSPASSAVLSEEEKRSVDFRLREHAEICSTEDPARCFITSHRDAAIVQRLASPSRREPPSEGGISEGARKFVVSIAHDISSLTPSQPEVQWLCKTLVALMHPDGPAISALMQRLAPSAPAGLPNEKAR